MSTMALKKTDATAASKKKAGVAPLAHPNLTPEGTYHYTECGLDNIYLENGFELLQDPSGEVAVAISHIDNLHKAIARDLVNRGSPIGGEKGGKEFRFLRTLMGYSQNSLARMMHTDGQSIARWENGKCYNAVADTMIRVLYMLHEGQDEEIREALERLADIDDLDHHVRLYKARRGKWIGDTTPIAA